jgi:thioredoxin-dependent peroxiredoxin
MRLKLMYFAFIIYYLSIEFCVAQKLQVQQPAPLFTVTDSKSDTVSIANYKGQKVFLSFFRYTSCPVCNFRIHELIEHYDSLKLKGYNIIAVFETPDRKLAEYVKDIQIPFPVIGDPDLILYRKYGVEKSFWRMIGSVFKKETRVAMSRGNQLYNGKKYKKDGNRSRLPADFIIDEEGIIIQVHYGTSISDHLPLKTLF